jgi:TFIIF-interacting CTD phosphatase-like protein
MKITYKNVNEKKGKIIVLDLDETLVHTMDNYESLIKLNILCDPSCYDIKKRTILLRTVDCVYKKGTGVIENMWSVKRPYLDVFLKFCFEYFDYVIVWSAGVRRYVRAIVENIFKDIGTPHIVYSREKCDSNENVSNYKPLNKLMEENRDYLKNMSLENTFVIDDRSSTFIKNVENGILIPEYCPEANTDEIRKQDTALLELMKWFLKDEVKNCNDVRTLNKSSIFVPDCKVIKSKIAN